MDWAVNFNPTPTSPHAFLDDPGNLCHAGFLAVARAMVEPIAQRLRTLLAEKPDRCQMSLLLTGHSAGGAVASLLYSHVQSQHPSVTSPLKNLALRLKRVHCVSFGAPPVSLLPLQKPVSAAGIQPDRLRKSLFFTFVNEGDPVARAEFAYVRSLLALYARPAPKDVQIWSVPQAVLSLAGRVILLRGSPVTSSREDSGGLLALLKMRKAKAGVTEVREQRMEAVVISDAQLRGAVFGDPLMHAMSLYARRVESLAVEAVTMRAE